MATKTWIGAAADVAQVTTLEIVNTWASGDTATITIGNRDLTVTSGSGTLQAIADEIVAALQGSSRREATSGYSWTAGGREYGEFLELVSVDDEGGGSTTITLQGPPGVPLDISESVVTAGTGDITLTTVQAATGKHFWDNADNWAEGSVPTDGDDIYFGRSAVACKYGFPGTPIDPASINISGDFEGPNAMLGLPLVNRDTAKPYYEYRTRFVTFDDNGLSDSGSITVGGGGGVGPTLANIDWQDKGTLTARVSSTGQPLPGEYAVNITGSGSTAVATVSGGSTAIAPLTSQAASVSFAIVQRKEPEDGPPAVLYLGPSVAGSSATASVIGGHLYNDSACAFSTMTVYPTGRLTAGALASDSPTQVLNYGGYLKVIGNGSPTTLYNQGTADYRESLYSYASSGSVTMTAGAVFIDPSKKTSWTNGFDLYQCGLEDVTLDWGPHRTLSISAI